MSPHPLFQLLPKSRVCSWDVRNVQRYVRSSLLLTLLTSPSLYLLIKNSYRRQTPIPVLNSLRRFRSSHCHPLHRCHPSSPICLIKLLGLGRQSLPTSCPCRVLHSIPFRPSLDRSRLGDSNQQRTSGTCTPRHRREQEDAINKYNNHSDIQIYLKYPSPCHSRICKLFVEPPAALEGPETQYPGLGSAVSTVYDHIHLHEATTKQRYMNFHSPTSLPLPLPSTRGVL